MLNSATSKNSSSDCASEKEQIEKVVEALKPFIELRAENISSDQQVPDPSIYLVHEAKDVAAEPVQRSVRGFSGASCRTVEYAADLNPEASSICVGAVIGPVPAAY